MTSTIPKTAVIGPVAARPYAWPFDGSVSTAHVALVCIDCDLIGFAHEIGEGGRIWAAGTSRARKQGAKTSN